MEQQENYIDPHRAALVVIDLQQGIVGMDAKPRSSHEVVANAARLASHMRSHGGLVVLVRVAFEADGKDRLMPLIDQAIPLHRGQAQANYSDLVPEMGPHAGDLVITKRQWGAFYGTPLDLELRRRGKDTIILCGIATNFGVESTARDAYERAYQQVFVEDAMASMTEEGHRYPLQFIFPRLGRIRTTDQVIAMVR